MHKVQYGSIWLSNGGSQAPRDFQVNGEQIAQLAPLLRASASALFGRGNRRLTISFWVAREHPSVIAAQQFLWLHLQSLAKQETALFYQQNGDLVVMADAVLTVTKQECAGAMTRHAYQFLGRQAIVSNFLTQEAQNVIIQTISIPAGVSQFSVGGLALPIVPTHIGGFIAKPMGGADIFSTVIAGSASANGWDVALSSITPSSGYLYTYFIGL